MAQDQNTKDVGEIFGLLRDYQKLLADLSTKVEILIDRDRRQTSDVDALQTIIGQLRDELSGVKNRLGRLGWLGSIVLAVTAAAGALISGAAKLWSAIVGGHG